MSQKKKGREEKKKMGEQGTDLFTRLQENSFGRIIQRHKVCASNMEHILENDLDLSNFYVEKMDAVTGRTRQRHTVCYRTYLRMI